MIDCESGPSTPVASLFLLRTVVVVIVVIARFLYCTFKIYSAIRLSSHKCVINWVVILQK